MRSKAKSPAGGKNHNFSISLIVTNFNGLKLLKKNLPKVIKYSPQVSEIIIADDASTDKSHIFLKKLQKKHPQIKLLTQKKNQGFVINSNMAVGKCKGELVVLLNNDITPTKNYIKNSLHHFKNPKLFGVGFAEIGNENWARIFWKEGYLQYEPGKKISKAHITAWLSGGGSIIRKSIFTKLRGFDNIYHPCYSEDLDLGYRAWKSGYTLIWEPKSKIYHKHQSTMSKLPKRFLIYVKERNRLLTVLRNITDPKLLTSNKIAIALRVPFGPNYIKIIRAAKRQIKNHLPPIVFPKLTDKQIFNKFKE
ncbi:glycosyltransferase [Patescibacteria group bacterium]|nr:glycosyltransferase [Patescibacteria group bacterium]MCG2701955.1 glycosyltransferase [Candidatus Parcubacteria bacterium]MBU4265150.1 glycosyltransferase [Patescibacteria group bacterium]MBU4390714.1 glycosyltransferase [Patescibacteria group bacterium]MBU4431122.1 glycosyltransferase [Patescibacteria group bacterium]